MRRVICATAGVTAFIAATACAAAMITNSSAPTGWDLVYDFLVQDVCTDASDKVLLGVSPIDGPAKCPRHRNLKPDERLPYHKNDWPGSKEMSARPYGYQRNDTYPIKTRAFGTAVVQSRGFVNADGQTGPFRKGHGGGGIWLFSDHTLASGLTQDPNGVQFFYGPSCNSENAAQRLLDAWVVVDKSYSRDRPGEMVARLTRFPEHCGHLAYAYTYWRTAPVAFRVRSDGKSGTMTFDTLISDHFGGRDRASAANMERFYFTRELGLMRWERWQNFARQKRPQDQALTEQTSASGQCDPIQTSPSTTGDWRVVRCRQYTNIVPPAEPGGDSPGFWIDTIRNDPQYARLFNAD